MRKRLGIICHMNKAIINRAIKHLGVEIQNERGAGYSYFTSLTTGDQIGESVPVCYLNQQSLERWVDDAVCACYDYRKQCELRGCPADALPEPKNVLKLSGNMTVIDVPNAGQPSFNDEA